MIANRYCIFKVLRMCARGQNVVALNPRTELYPGSLRIKKKKKNCQMNKC